jgi:hypothetical protein
MMWITYIAIGVVIGFLLGLISGRVFQEDARSNYNTENKGPPTIETNVKGVHWIRVSDGSYTGDLNELMEKYNPNEKPAPSELIAKFSKE